MTVRRFNVPVGKKTCRFLNLLLYQETRTFFIGFIGRFNAGIKFIKTFQKIFRFFLSMRPYKENIILSEPYQGLQLLRFTKTCLKHIHEKTRIL